MEYQTRSEENGINYFDTLGDVMKAAKNDITIWKISFDSKSDERIRLVRGEDGKFYLGQLMDEVLDALR